MVIIVWLWCPGCWIVFFLSKGKVLRGSKADEKGIRVKDWGEDAVILVRGITKRSEMHQEGGQKTFQYPIAGVLTVLIESTYI